MKENIIPKARAAVQKVNVFGLLLLTAALFITACAGNSAQRREQPAIIPPEESKPAVITQAPNPPPQAVPEPEPPVSKPLEQAIPEPEPPEPVISASEVPAPIISEPISPIAVLPEIEQPVPELPIVQETPEIKEIVQQPQLPEPELPQQQLPLMALAIPETMSSVPEAQPPVIRSVIPEYLLGKGQVEAEKLGEFLIYYHPGLGDFAMEMAQLYVEEAAIEGINHDAAFAQMCLETGFLRFGGLVLPEMNNFCGLGAFGPANRGESFPDPRTGVRAHIQHLKAYASEEPLQQELVDPRYFLVRLGSSPKISGLAGTWAVDLQYGVKINSILERLYEFSFRKNT